MSDAIETQVPEGMILGDEVTEETEETEETAVETTEVASDQVAE